MIQSLSALTLLITAVFAQQDCTKTDGTAGDGISCKCILGTLKQTCKAEQVCNVNSEIKVKTDCCTNCCKSASCTCPDEKKLCLYPTCPSVDGSAIFKGFKDVNDDTKIKVKHCQCGNGICNMGQKCNKADSTKCNWDPCPTGGKIWVSATVSSYECKCSETVNCMSGYLCTSDGQCEAPACDPTDGSAKSTATMKGDSPGCKCGSPIDGFQPHCFSGEQLFCDASRTNGPKDCRCGFDSKGSCTADSTINSGSDGSGSSNSNSTGGKSQGITLVVAKLIVVVTAFASFLCAYA